MMTKVLSCALAIALVPAVTPATAAPAVAAEPYRGRRGEAVEGAILRLHRAMIEADAAALRHLSADELTYGHSNGQVQDREGFIAGLLAGKPDFTAIDFKTEQVAIKPSVAVVRGVLLTRIATEHGTEPLGFRVLYVLIREAGRWKLLTRQSAPVGP